MLEGALKAVEEFHSSHVCRFSHFFTQMWTKLTALHQTCSESVVMSFNFLSTLNMCRVVNMNHLDTRPYYLLETFVMVLIPFLNVSSVGWFVFWGFLLVRLDLDKCRCWAQTTS